MKIVVDWDLCEGNAVCVKVAPEVFEVRDDDKAHLKIANPGEDLREKLERAVQRCPRQAIALRWADEGPWPAALPRARRVAQRAQANTSRTATSTRPVDSPSHKP